MLYHTEFLVLSTNKDKIIPLCGSDGVYVLDGRWGISTMIIKNRVKKNSINKYLNKGIIGFNIRHSNRFSKSVIIRTFIDGQYNHLIREF